MRNAIFFLVVILLSVNLTACSSSPNTSNSSNSDVTNSISAATSEPTSIDDESASQDEITDNSSSSSDLISQDTLEEKQRKVDQSIEEYNKVASTPITDTVEIDITDKESGHYRTEFRLTPFANAYSKTGKIGDVTIDIICYGFFDDSIRVYATVTDIDEAKEIILTASPILDSSLTETDLQEVSNYIDEHGEANGYYYGDIGLVLLSHELMLKVE